MKQHLGRVAGGIVSLLLVVGAAAGSAKAEATAAEVYSGVTRPSEERALSFSYPGVVREVFVKEGQKVKSGEALLQLDDRIDRNMLATLEIEANSPLKVEYAAKSRDQKKVRLARIQELAKKDAATPLELEEATLNSDLAVTQFSLSEEERQTAKFKAEGQKIKVDLARMVSTIDGIVQRISVKAGEYSDPQQSQRPAVMVVKNDPLKIEVFVPTTVATKLAAGQELEATYADEESWQKAHLTFADPVADPGSGLRRLYLEMPNPQGREAGLQVKVRVPAK